VALFKLFLALSLEVKIGRVGRDDLDDRLHQIAAGNISKGEGALGTPLSDAQGRYLLIPLHDNVLTDDVLVDILFEGWIDQDAINHTLSISEHFVRPEDEPNWQKVWHGILRDEKEFASACAAMEKEFEERKFDEPGVVLHVFGMRLWTGTIGQLTEDEAAIVAECKRYVDDLCSEGRLQKMPERLRDGSHGLMFHGNETPAFESLVSYYQARAEEAFRSLWPSIADDLMGDMTHDAEKFYARICWDGATRPDCADDAVLSAINPATFVDKLLSCAPGAQRTIFSGLRQRYQTGRLANALARERDWMVAVRAELSGRMDTLSPIRRYSISNDFERLVNPMIPKST
jgi:hypothetical protein